MNYPHWEYFLTLDLDMERAARFVALEAANFSSYSIELTRLLFAACSELEVVAKALCARVDPSARQDNIDDYRKIITKAYPGLHSVKAVITRYSLELQPWSDWGKAANPAWWRSYNNVKHQRIVYFAEANLRNTIDSLAGLFLLTLYYYQSPLYDHKLLPWTNLFDLHPDHYRPFRFVGRYDFPDFGNSDDWRKSKPP